MKFRNLKESEFWRLAETCILTDFTLYEANNDPGKFQFIARHPSTQTMFSVRHARGNTLTNALHQHGITAFHVRMQPQQTQ